MTSQKIWHIHHGSDCPIPRAKAGEYEIRWKHFGIYSPNVDAPDVWWGDPPKGHNDRVVAYRLLEPIYQYDVIFEPHDDLANFDPE